MTGDGSWLAARMGYTPPPASPEPLGRLALVLGGAILVGAAVVVLLGLAVCAYLLWGLL